eukprot:CCRYP_017950-RA/>CCRYP_017950-RA protein AED:0.35 eAED:0.85 QI:0/0/0/1/0/0.5/2/139/459
MSSVKAIPEGLKWVECERGVGGKNSPIRYIPEQDPVQDALAKDKKTTYFKLTLPNTGNELKVAVWASGTPEQFLLHVRSAIHACKQMGLDTDFAAAERAVETATFEAEVAKQEYVMVRNAEKKKKGTKQDAPSMTTEAASPALGQAKAVYDKVLKALEDAKLAVATAGAKPFELYGNLLSDEARQPWEKIIKVQVTNAPWEDIKGVPHTETPTKTWNSFHECVTFHLLQVFHHDAGEALKYYITNTLKKPNRVSIRQFFVRVEQLNSYLETLPCLYYSPKANQATKKVLPLDDADLATHLLRMCPAKWQTQYDLTENTTPVSTRALLLVLENIENNAELDNKPANTTKAKGADTKRKMESMDSRIPKKPKKVGWTKKHCVLCKKHGGLHKSHNTRDCRRYNKDGTPIKKNGVQVSPAQKKGNQKIVRAELKKALCKKSSKRRKRCANDSESDSDSDDSS